MKALVLQNDAEAAAASARALMQKGFQVVCVETRKVAHAMIRIETVDLLLMEERVEDRLTHALALSAERRNPYINIILMTDRAAEETDDLYSLIPSLYALVGTSTEPSLLGQLALSSTENYEEAEARVRRNAMDDKAEEESEDDLNFDELKDVIINEEELEHMLDSQAVISAPEVGDAEQSVEESEFEEIPEVAAVASFTDHVEAFRRAMEEHDADMLDDVQDITEQVFEVAQVSAAAVSDARQDIPSYADAARLTPAFAEHDWTDAEDAAVATYNNYESDSQEDRDERLPSHQVHMARVSVVGRAQSVELRQGA